MAYIRNIRWPNDYREFQQNNLIFISLKIELTGQKRKSDYLLRIEISLQESSNGKVVAEPSSSSSSEESESPIKSSFCKAPL